jgi:alpha-2-macroglobulin
VGEVTANILTRQEIVVRPILPRILTTGDSVALSAIVHNYSSGRKEIDVALQVREVEGIRPLAVSSPLTQTISLGAGELRIVGWQATVAEATKAEIVVRADIGDETADAVLLTLPIRPLAVPDVTSQVGQFTGELATAIPLPAGALSMSTVRIELSRSIAGSLLHGLEFLTGFPYGCVEQTMSKALPNAAVGRALYQLGVSDPTLLADLPDKVNAGLQRLYGYQHNDGGWGWWYDDLSDDYQTAWVVFGLAVTAEAGYEVDPTVIERGAVWLADHLSAMDIRSRAYALYSMALAGHGDRAETEALLAQQDELDTFSRAALALTLHRLGARAEARALIDALAESAVIQDGRVSWTGEEYDGHYHQKFMSSAVRSTALALSAFVEVRPGHALEPGIVRWLMSQRRQEGWGSTNETSYTVLALTDHLLASRAAMAESTYSVLLNGVTLAEGRLGPDEPAVSLTIPAAQMATGINSLRIRQTGGGMLYYTISSRVFLAQEQIEPAGGIQVTREYIDLASGQPITTAVAGELVEVRLQFTLAERGAFLVIEDRVPGGLEPLNERLNTTSHVASADPYQEPVYFWQEHGYNHKEIHGDRVSFFVTELDAGRHTYTYLARATHRGDFAALPAEVWAMYDLATWGRSSSSRLEVTGVR